jgi:hypothetical protein
VPDGPAGAGAGAAQPGRDHRLFEDGNDADALRSDPMFKLALERLPSEADLCSQSTISRLENLPNKRALVRLAGTLIDQYCSSFRQVPRRIVLDIDSRPPSNRATTALPATGDRPGRKGVLSTMAGARSC